MAAAPSACSLQSAPDGAGTARCTLRARTKSKPSIFAAAVSPCYAAGTAHDAQLLPSPPHRSTRTRAAQRGGESPPNSAPPCLLASNGDAQLRAFPCAARHLWVHIVRRAGLLLLLLPAFLRHETTKRKAGIGRSARPNSSYAFRRAPGSEESGRTGKHPERGPALTGRGHASRRDAGTRLVSSPPAPEKLHPTTPAARQR